MTKTYLFIRQTENEDPKHQQPLKPWHGPKQVFPWVWLQEKVPEIKNQLGLKKSSPDMDQDRCFHESDLRRRRQRSRTTNELSGGDAKWRRMQRTGFRFRTKSPKNKTQEDLKKSSLDMDQNISFHESDRRRRCSGSSVVQLLFELATCFALSLGNCITLVTLRFPPCLDTCNRLCNFAWTLHIALAATLSNSSWNS